MSTALRRSQRRTLFTMLAIATAALPAFTALDAFAQAAWPTRPIKLICGYPAGSSPDVQARLLAEPLSKALGQPVVVDNKPGAGGNIGADLLAKSTDDHTIAIIGNGPLTSASFLYTKLAYDPSKDFAPIALVGAAPIVWVVPKAAMTGSGADYIKWLKGNGDKANYGSIGAGSGSHLGMELIKESTGVNPVHVPYPGGPQILNGMLAGEIQMTLLPYSTVLPHIQSGKLAPVAVTSAQRSPLSPEIPSMTEVGVTGVNIEVWNAIMAPAKMPAAHQQKLNAEIGKILNSKEMTDKLFQLGWQVGDTSPKALADRIQSDTALYGQLIKAKGYKLD